MLRNLLSRAGVRVLLAAASVVLAFGLPPARAERLESPLELLHAPGNLLVAGPLLEANVKGRLVFGRGEVLGGNGKPPPKIDVRAPQAAIQRVQVGRHYIFGYSTARPDPRNPTRTIADPAGAILLTSTGLDPALFDDTPAARAILKAGGSEHRRESRRFFDLLMKALAGPDPQLQNLAVGEIALEPEIGARLDDRARAAIAKVALDPAVAPGVRATLLSSAAARPRELGQWWSAAAVKILETTPVDGYAAKASDPTDLVLVAFEVTGAHAVDIPATVLRRWVRSASPALVERACLALRRQSPAAERSAIAQALADPALPARTRKFLDGHLHRLDRLDGRNGARKDSTNRS